MIHIRVSTPMYQGSCSGYYVETLLDLANQCEKFGIGMSWDFLYNESMIAKGRNQLVHNFLKSEATHILFVDADMKISGEDIIRMIQADKDVIAAVCPKKIIDWERVRLAVSNNEENLERRTGSYNFVPLQINTNIEIHQYEPLEVSRAGTGVMLIKRQVFDQLKSHTRMFKNEDNEIVFEYFRMDINEESLFIGEDYYFCNLFRANGGKIFVAPWTAVGHHGPMLYQGTLF